MSVRNAPNSAAKAPVVAAATLALVAGGVAWAPSAAAQTYTKSFEVSCTQAYVNAGAPFPVQVDVTLEVPDELTVGDVVEPQVDLNLTMDPGVAFTITGYGYDTLNGLVDATVQVVEGGTVTDLTATDFVLPSTEVSSASQQISMVTSPEFPSYTTLQEGNATVIMSGGFVTVHDVVVANSVTGNSFALGDFNCSAEDTIEVGVMALAPEVTPEPATSPTVAPTPGVPIAAAGSSDGADSSPRASGVGLPSSGN
ncbi:MAG: DUF6801 domain-containing protein [Arachnia sp.]